jgi:hypothetical protein
LGDQTKIQVGAKQITTISLKTLLVKSKGKNQVEKNECSTPKINKIYIQEDKVCF